MDNKCAELDKLLSQETTVDSWYDDGYLIARDIMTEFLEEDWKQLYGLIEDKSVEWKKKLAYSIDNQLIEEELKVLFCLLDTDDEELLFMCKESLRSFDSSMIKRFPESNN